MKKREVVADPHLLCRNRAARELILVKRGTFSVRGLLGIR